LFSRPLFEVKWDFLPARRRIADGRIWRNFFAVVNRPSPAAAQNQFSKDGDKNVPFTAPHEVGGWSVSDDAV
jgi:hypothetical protein